MDCLRFTLSLTSDSFEWGFEKDGYGRDILDVESDASEAGRSWLSAGISARRLGELEVRDDGGSGVASDLVLLSADLR